MKPNTHIAFDLDGTLINSIDLMQKSWNHATSKLGINVRFSQYREYIGIPFRDIIKKLNLEDDDNELYKLYFEFNKKHCSEINLNNGVKEIIEYLNISNIKWSIITSKPKESSLEILKCFNLVPEYIICPEDVTNGKPNNESIIKLKERANLKHNTKIYYVGDMLSDLLFSVESNVEYIHYAGGIDGPLNANIMNNFHQIDDLMEIKSIMSCRLD